MSILRTLLSTLTLLALSPMAKAQVSCDGFLIAVNYCAGDSSCLALLQASDPIHYAACMGSSAKTANAISTINATSFNQIQQTSNAVADRMLARRLPSPGQQLASKSTGVAAGNEGEKFNFWGNLSHVHSEYSGDHGVSLADQSKSHVMNTLLGVDYSIAKNLVVGVSLADDRGHGSMGSAATATSTHGYNLAPYFGWQISQSLALDTIVGWGKGNFHGSNVDQDTRRSFYGVNLTHNQWINNFQLTGKASWLSAEEKYGSTNNASRADYRIDRFRLGGELGYWINGMMPYVGVAYTTDHRSADATSALGKNAMLWSVGMNFFSLAYGITGGISYTTETARSNGINNIVGANVSMKF